MGSVTKVEILNGKCWLCGNGNNGCKMLNAAELSVHDMRSFDVVVEWYCFHDMCLKMDFKTHVFTIKKH